MVHTVRLAATSADFYIMRETSLEICQYIKQVYIGVISANLPSWQREGLGQSHYPAPVLDCYQESLAARIGLLLPSYVQSFPELALVL